MIAARTGAIVNFSSVAEFFGWPLRDPYAATKAAVSSLTRTLATEWAHLGVFVTFGYSLAYAPAWLIGILSQSGRVIAVVGG